MKLTQTDAKLVHAIIRAKGDQPEVNTTAEALAEATNLRPVTVRNRLARAEWRDFVKHEVDITVRVRNKDGMVMLDGPPNAGRWLLDGRLPRRR